MPESRSGDDITVGAITNAQGIAIGRNARAQVTGNVIAGTGQEVDSEVLAAAIKGLRKALQQTSLPEDAQLQAETATGTALIDGIKDGAVEPTAVVQNLQKVGAALRQANVAIEEGSALRESIARLAPLLAPLVQGGARAIGAWFGVPL